MHYWFYGGHMIWMTISWLVGIGLFSLFIWLVVSAIDRGPESTGSPEEVLRRRYAAGEIQIEEYERCLAETTKDKERSVRKQVGAKWRLLAKQEVIRMESLLSVLVFIGFFFLMMRFGCGAHMRDGGCGHSSHHHDNRRENVPDRTMSDTMATARDPV